MTVNDTAEHDDNHRDIPLKVKWTDGVVFFFKHIEIEIQWK